MSLPVLLAHGIQKHSLRPGEFDNYGTNSRKCWELYHQTDLPIVRGSVWYDTEDQKQDQEQEQGKKTVNEGGKEEGGH